MIKAIDAFFAKWVPIVTPQWLPAFNAHWAWSYFVVFTVAVKRPHWLIATVIVSILVAAFKEFYLDKHYETTKQTFRMNLFDFAGYMFGLVLALLLARVHAH